jgi:hypothetical protein
MDISAIAGALSSIKAAKGIAESMVGLRDAQAIQSKIIEFQSRVFDAQGSALAAQDERALLVETVRNLKQKIAALEEWGADKQRYELRKWGHGAFAYVLKESEAGVEPPHALCANCYTKNEKSILQANGQQRITDHAWDCPRCKASVKAHQRWLSPQPEA